MRRAVAAGNFLAAHHVPEDPLANRCRLPPDVGLAGDGPPAGGVRLPAAGVAVS